VSRLYAVGVQRCADFAALRAAGFSLLAHSVHGYRSARG